MAKPIGVTGQAAISSTSDCCGTTGTNVQTQTGDSYWAGFGSSVKNMNCSVLYRIIRRIRAVKNQKRKFKPAPVKMFLLTPLHLHHVL